MTKFPEHGLPCPCGESSDAYAVDQNGKGHCFSCGEPEWKINKRLGLEEKGEDLSEDTEQIDDDDVDYVFKKHRGISEKTAEFYKIRTKTVKGEDFSWGFQYANGAIKVKKVDGPKKSRYSWVGSANEAGLFGKNLFLPGSKRTIIVTEGEHDAPSFYELLNGSVAAVSVQSSSTALRDITLDRDYLNSFDRIVIAFDNDEQGQSAMRKVMASGLFDFNKLYHIPFTKYKDANQYLQEGDFESLMLDYKAAKKYTPDNIISTFDEIKKALHESHEDEIGTYPTQTLNDMLYGLYRGQVVCIKGMEGIGKTEIFRMMEYHLLKTTECKLGIIHMEEDKSTTIKGLATYELGVPCNLPDAGVSEEGILEGYTAAVGNREDRVYIYTMFGGDDPDDVLDSIRFVVASGGVDVVFLDHITMLVTGTEEGDERRKLDYMSTKLKKMCKELKFCLVLISHVNDDGQTRGSRNITKIADVVIHLDRDKLSEDEIDKNSLFLMLEKNRKTGRTGRAGQLFFNSMTFKLEEVHV